MKEHLQYHNEPIKAFMRDRHTTKICGNINWTEALTTYCEKSSLHGLKYVGDLQLHPLER